MLGIKVKSAVKCHLFTPTRPPGEPAPLLKTILEETLSWVEQSEAFVHAERLESGVKTAVGHVKMNTHIQTRSDEQNVVPG